MAAGADFLALRNDHSVIHPTYAQRVVDDPAYIGCSFVARAKGGRLWALFPAHLLACGASLHTLDRWAIEANVRFTSDRGAVSLPLFLGRDRKPNFKGPPGTKNFADIVALPLDGAFAKLVSEADAIDLSGACPDEISAGANVIMRGYPSTGGKWPPACPLPLLGTITGKYTLDIMPLHGLPLPGYSGTAVFAVPDGAFVGMLVAAKDDRAFMIPAGYIWRFVNDELSDSDDVPYQVSGKELLSPVAGLINATDIIAPDVIVTEHLTGNAVTHSDVATGGGAHTLSTSPTWTTLCSISDTFTGGNVQLTFTDYCTWSGAAPTVYYRIVRDSNSQVAYTQAGGGSAVPENINVSGSGLDTGAAAGSHTYALQACCIGGTTSSNAASLTVTELKR